MKPIIHIQNLNYSTLFSNLNLDIKKGTFLSIVGRNGCGKSLLMKIILGLIPVDGEIQIDDLSPAIDKQNILRKVGVVFENPDANFVAETPREDMILYLSNLGYKQSNILERIDEYAEKFEIKNLLDYSVTNLSGGEKQLIALVLALLNHPSILLLDDAFSMIDGMQKEKIYKMLKKINREEKTTIIQITHDMNDTLYGKEIAILDEKKVIVYGKKETILEDEKIFKKAGLELPFMASLSSKLRFYELVDDTILDMDKMVNILWK